MAGRQHRQIPLRKTQMQEQSLQGFCAHPEPRTRHQRAPAARPQHQGERHKCLFARLKSARPTGSAAKPPRQVRGALSRWRIIDAPVSLEQHRLFSPEPQETLELEQAGNHHTESSGRHRARGSRLFLLLPPKKNPINPRQNCAHSPGPAAVRCEHPAEESAPASGLTAPINN